MTPGAPPPAPPQLDFVDILPGTDEPVEPRLVERLPWKKIASFLESVETPRTVEAMAGQVLSSLEPLVPFDFGFSVVTSTVDIRRTRLFLQRYAPESLLREYFGHYIEIDPALPLLPSVRRGVVNWGLSRTPFFREFLSPYKVHQSLVINDLLQTQAEGFVLVLHRGGSGFDERERATLAALLPHLHNLYSTILEPQIVRLARLSSITVSARLTRREAQVTLLLADRLSSREIADRLFISRRTVEKHIEHVYAKMDARGRRDLRRLLAEE